MKNTLIASRPGGGKTYYAIDYYVTNIAKGTNGVFVTLELYDTELMDKIMQHKARKNITLHKGGVKILYITPISNIEVIIDYIEKIDTPIEYVIVDYLQLLDAQSDLETFFEYTKKKGLSVLMTTQMTQGEEVEGQTHAELLLRIREQNILKYFDEVKFLSKNLGIIEFEK